MKKFISLFLIVTMITAFFATFPASAAIKVDQITDEQLFSTYAAYLSNKRMDEGLKNADAAYRAVLNSYNESDETVATYMSAMSEGVSIVIKEGLAELGLSETYYDSLVKKAATRFMQSMISNENVVKKASDIVEKAYNTLNDSYSVAQSIDKTTLLVDLVNVAEECDISITPDDMDEIVNGLYDSGTLEKDLKAIGHAQDMWKVVFELTQIHAIEKTTLNLILDELRNTNQTYSDLYHGLSMLKADMERDPLVYLGKYYLTETAIGFLAEQAGKLLGVLTSGNAVLLVTSFTKLYADYIYADAKADDITQLVMQTSFINNLEICLSDYRGTFRNKKGTSEDIKNYETLYGAYLSAYVSTLESAYDVAKLKDKFSLGGDCTGCAEDIKCYYTYDNYITWCKEAIVHDIANGELDKESGDSTITDALNEETIKARLDKIRAITRYAPNAGNTYRDAYQTEGTMGFAAKVFELMFDRQMGKRVESKYKHILTNNKNVRVIGRLEEDDVTKESLKELFSDVRIGDVLITSGQYDYLHAMIVISVEDDGVVVYDCDSRYIPGWNKDSERYQICEYKISYEKMADAFSKNGEYLTTPGISVYRAIYKVNTTNSGEKLYYTEYDDSVNYLVNNGVLYQYTGTNSTIRIPEGVTEIASSCFAEKTNIQYVYMPDTVTKIGSQAFYRCTGLLYVDFSRSLKTIDYWAFDGCSSLGSLRLPDSVTYIGENAFSNCEKLNVVELSDNITEVASGLFSSCEALESIVIPEGVTSIGRAAFSGCKSLEKIKILSTVINIGPSAFSKTAYYSDTTNWENGFLYIDNHLIKYLGSAYEFPHIKEGTLSIAGEAFYNEHSANNYSDNKIKTIVIPMSVRAIGDRAFLNCRKLEDITIFNGIEYMGHSVFDNTAYYNNGSNWAEGVLYMGGCLVDVKDTVKEINVVKDTSCIAYLAFENATSLESITIDAKIKELNQHVFSSIESLTNVTLGDSVTSIGNSAFIGCKNLTNINIPDSVTSIGNYAFSGCKALNDITLPNSLTYIGESAFSGCSFEEITIPGSLKEIGPMAFWGCGLKSVNILPGVEYIGSGAFQSCDSLENVIIPNTVVTIDSCAFYFCGNLKEVYIPGSVETIGDAAFSATGLKFVDIAEGVKEIGYEAFRACNSLISVNMPRSITHIDETAFTRGTFFVHENSYAHEFAKDHASYMLIDANNFIASGTCGDNITWSLDCYGKLTLSGYGPMKNYSDRYPMTPWYYDGKFVRSLKIENGITTIGDYAFDADQLYIYDLELPDSITKIGECAFFYSFEGTHLNIPDKVTHIGDFAFAYSSFTDVTLPKSLVEIGAGAFNNSYNLATIYYGGSEEEWSKINIVDSYNDILKNATIKYLGTTVSEDGNSFTVTLKPAFEGKKVILALYQNEKFLGMQSAIYDGTELIFTTDKPYTDVKIMVWEDSKDMKPVCEAEIVK